jgi:cellulase (glycosyl hydrolase family 5)/glycosyl hydrolase family 5
MTTGTRRTRTMSLAQAIAICGSLAATCPPPGPTTPATLGSYTFLPGSARSMTKDGTWFRDAAGRYVLFRGVNFGSRSKRPPYLPVLPISVTTVSAAQVDQELNAIGPDLARLHDMGMNIVRIPVMWNAIEPTPNAQLDRLVPAAGPYLAALHKVIDNLYYRHGLFVIIDFHQDIAQDAYNGDGFPDWALAIDANHPRPSPPDFRDSKWGSNYFDLSGAERLICGCGGNGPVVRHTLESFWNDLLFNAEQTEAQRVLATAQNPRTHLEKTIGQVAKYFVDVTNGGHPGIIGYELFNEPHPVGLGKQDFEQRILPGFYGRALFEIRQHDDKSFVFVEPRVDWTTYSADGDEYQGLSFTLVYQSFLPTPFLSEDPRAVLAFHYYDPWLTTGFPFARNMHDKVREWPGVFRQLRAAADSRGLIPFLTEYGCSEDWRDDTDLRPDIYQHLVVRACLDLQLQQIEAQVLNATYWNYDLYATQADKDNWNLENFSLLGPGRVPRDLDIMTRPYPMRSSAKPQLISFDLSTKNAAILLQGPVVAEPTVIFVPRTVHYAGDDFEVRATSKDVVWDEANRMLYWIPDATRSQNQIIISPRNGFLAAALPIESQTMLPETKFAMVVGLNKRMPVPL